MALPGPSALGEGRASVGGGESCSCTPARPLFQQCCHGELFPTLARGAGQEGRSRRFPVRGAEYFLGFSWCAGGWLADPPCSARCAVKRSGQDWGCFTGSLSKITGRIRASTASIPHAVAGRLAWVHDVPSPFPARDRGGCSCIC